MTKAKALDSFFNSFGIPAYPSTRVPDKVAFPYLTYEPTLANLGKTTHPRISLWYFGTTERDINAKADDIQKAIDEGISVRCDDGLICIYCPEGWQAIDDQADVRINGRTTNLSITFNTK